MNGLTHAHLEGKESQPPIRGIAKTICKKAAAPPPNSGKNHYLERLNHPSRSTSWKYFTGDVLLPSRITKITKRVRSREPQV